MDKGAKKQEKELPVQILGKFENSKMRTRTRKKNKGNKDKKEQKGYKQTTNIGRHNEGYHKN